MRQLPWASVQFRGLDPLSAVMGQRSVIGVGPCVSCHGPTFSLGGWTLHQPSWTSTQFSEMDGPCISIFRVSIPVGLNSRVIRNVQAQHPFPFHISSFVLFSA